MTSSGERQRADARLGSLALAATLSKKFCALQVAVASLLLGFSPPAVRAQSVASVAGTYSADQTVVLTATQGGQTDTETLRGSNPSVVLTQSGSTFSFTITDPSSRVSLTETFVLSGNSIVSGSGPVLGFQNVPGLSVSQNQITSATGTVSQGRIDLSIRGRVVGVLDRSGFTIDVVSTLVLRGNATPGSTPPAITTQPQGQSVTAGANVTFSATASGSTTLTYQWRKDGVDIPGATSSSYTISGVQPPLAGLYSVVVTNPFGSATSGNATLTVVVGPANDRFANRVVISGTAVAVSGTTVGAAKEPGEPNHAGTTGGRSVWWTWTAPGAGLVTVDTAGSGFDTVLAVYTGSVISGLTFVASNDDAGGGLRTSRLTFTATARTVYQIAVDGFGTGGLVRLNLNQATAPVIASQPRSVVVGAGSTLALGVGATGTGPLGYQWRKNGVVVAGATAASLVVNALTTADAADYTVVVSNTLGSVTSAAASVALAPTGAGPSRLINLSVRSAAGTDSQTLIVGFALGGVGTAGGKPILIRGIGPALGAFGVPGTLADPQLTLFSGATALASNDDWGGNAQVASVGAQVGAFALASPASKDAALYRPAQASGSFSVQLTGAGADVGIALAEIYDATPAAGFTVGTPRLVNVSARTQAGAGDDVLIVGFVISGARAQTVLVRGIGPALTGFGVAGALVDPKLELFNGSTKIGENDDWGGSAVASGVFARVGAFALVGTASKDAALLITLAPGAYTAQLSGVGETTGVALVEVYEVP